MASSSKEIRWNNEKISLRDIQRWNPEKITSDILSQAFQEAEQRNQVTEADVMFAEGLLQKFKGLLLACLDSGRVSQEQFRAILVMPITAMTAEANLWRIRCAQVMQWLEEHASRRNQVEA